MEFTDSLSLSKQGPCVGGACLWFSEGCFLGCSSCSATMPTGGNQHNVPNCSGFVPNVPSLPEEYRTYNIHNLSGDGDWTRYHPWRSPGKCVLPALCTAPRPILFVFVCCSCG